MMIITGYFHLKFNLKKSNFLLNNKDWSLQFVVQKCFKDHIVSLYPTFSRVVHLGEWFDLILFED